MILPIIIDGLKCECRISRINWIKSIFSMLIHFDNPMLWRFFWVTDITHPTYRDRDGLFIEVANIDWKRLWEDARHNYIIKLMRGE